MNVRGVGLRRLAYAGARYGPRFWVKYSPALFGLAFACSLPDARASIRSSLHKVRGPRGRLRDELDVARTFVAYAHCFAESLAGERPEARVAEPVVRGGEYLREVARAGRGAILVTAHCGAWDAAARYLARDYDAEVLVVMAKEPDGRARGVSDVVRERGGLRVAHVGGHPLDSLKVLAHLRRGGFVAVQLDRVAGLEATIPVRFRGVPFQVPAGPFRLAAMTGVPVVPVFTCRLGYFQHEIVIAPPIKVSRGDAPGATVAEAAERATAEMERFLASHPTQWFAFSR